MMRAEETIEGTQSSLKEDTGADPAYSKWSKKHDKKNKKSIIHYLTTQKFDDLSHVLSQTVAETADEEGGKSIGFNITHLGEGGTRVEFRYPGGPDVTAEKIDTATLYYAWLVLLAVEPGYKEEEYKKKLTRTLNKIEAGHGESGRELKWAKEIKPGTIFVDHSRRFRSNTTDWKSLVSYMIPKKITDGSSDYGDAIYNFSTRDDFVMFKKMDKRNKIAKFIRVSQGAPGGELRLKEFSLTLKNFELDLQDGTLSPIGTRDKYLRETDSASLTWKIFKKSAAGDVSPLEVAKIKFIRKVFAALKKFSGQLSGSDIVHAMQKTLNHEDEMYRIKRLVREVRRYYRLKGEDRLLDDNEAMGLLRDLTDDIDETGGTPEYRKREFYNAMKEMNQFMRDMGGEYLEIGPLDWGSWDNIKDNPDWRSMADIDDKHAAVRKFIEKLDVSTEELQDIEKKQTDDMVKKIMGLLEEVLSLA